MDHDVTLQHTIATTQSLLTHQFTLLSSSNLSPFSLPSPPFSFVPLLCSWFIHSNMQQRGQKHNRRSRTFSRARQAIENQ